MRNFHCWGRRPAAAALFLVAAAGVKQLPRYSSFLAYAAEPKESLSRSAYPGLNSALWMRWSAEYRAACTQAYRLATLQLDAALRTPTWTAATEQTKGFAKLPPAVIFDLDETLFNNSPYDAALVKAGLDYDAATFLKWNASGGIQPLSGSVAFAKYAAGHGVELYYVSNRGPKDRDLTLRNMRRMGFPLRSPDNLLLRGERAVASQTPWNADKTGRRRFVAGNYRILLLLGDDFNDFLSIPATATIQQRERLEARYQAYWGSRWVILPNPHYGSWENTLLSGARGDEAIRRKLSLLNRQ